MKDEEKVVASFQKAMISVLQRLPPEEVLRAYTPEQVLRAHGPSRCCASARPSSASRG